MKYFVTLLLLSYAVQATQAQAATLVKMQTNQGTVVLELDSQHAPKTVSNFLRYVQEGFYEGTIFHRVIDNFMIQGGGLTKDFQHKQTHDPVPNEANNGLKNVRGTLVMARTSDPQSAAAQFFINVKDNDFLDYVAATPRGWGYAVFGKVVEGMEVVEKISKTETGSGGPFEKDVPKTAIVIEKMSVVEETPKASVTKEATETAKKVEGGKVKDTDQKKAGTDKTEASPSSK